MEILDTNPTKFSKSLLLQFLFTCAICFVRFHCVRSRFDRFRFLWFRFGRFRFVQCRLHNLRLFHLAKSRQGLIGYLPHPVSGERMEIKLQLPRYHNMYITQTIPQFRTKPKSSYLSVIYAASSLLLTFSKYDSVSFFVNVLRIEK